MSQWGAVDPAPRLAILSVMPLGERITVAAIAKALGKHTGTIDQMLHALKADKLVDCATSHNGYRVWWRTAVPIPEKFTSTAIAKAGLHDATALREALGDPKQPPTPLGARIVRR